MNILQRQTRENSSNEPVTECILHRKLNKLVYFADKDDFLSARVQVRLDQLDCSMTHSVAGLERF